MALSSAPIFQPTTTGASLWTLREIAGRFVEISSSAASAALTIVFALVREAQEQGEPVGWVTSMENFFYPPDAAQVGIDLTALAVIRLPRSDNIPRAGEKLLRSGGFGVVVLDLGGGDIPMPLQSRLTGLAHHHHTALICLTEKEQAMLSIGSLVSLRVHAVKRRAHENGFACALNVVKDKRRGPTWTHEVFCSGPAGLC
jgi:recombination protein RecA